MNTETTEQPEAAVRCTGWLDADYAKLAWQEQRHHERYKRFVAAMPKKLVCQECGGAGGEVEPVLDYGEGPFFDCGWCEGTGWVTPHLRAMWLMSKRQASNGRDQ